MNTTGKLNLDGKVEIEFKEDAWGLLMKGIINKVPHSCLIDYKEGSKAKMNVIIDQSFSSSVLESKTIAGNTLRSSLEFKFTNGIHRAENSLVNHLCKNAWFLFGYIDNTVKKSICIVYFVDIKMAFYAIMKEGDDPKSFNPQNN